MPSASAWRAQAPINYTGMPRVSNMDAKKVTASTSFTDDTGSGSAEKVNLPLSRFAAWAKSLSVETNGIERVTDEEREKNTTKPWNACTFWLSANMAVATLSTGMTASFGLTGLRMTTFSRYSFGYWGNLLVVVFSMVTTTGWNVINSISGASVLAALSDGKFPPWAGVIIICTTVWIICVLGIKWIHRLDTFIWIAPFVVWCVAAGTGAPHLHGEGVKSPIGPNGAASALSFIAVVFSFAVSWVNCAADYNVRMPRNTPRSKIFLWTYIGIFVPATLVQILGAALYSGTEGNAAWKHAYTEYGVGGPLKMALEPAGGFGKFLMVIAALSSIPNNIPNNYSFAMHAQNFGPWAIQIPRIFLVTFGFVVAVIVGCFAAEYFHDSLQTFLSIIGYWTRVDICFFCADLSRF
ncbi:Purine-cytosine permease fcyB, partial [Lachnellula suecica]